MEEIKSAGVGASASDKAKLAKLKLAKMDYQCLNKISTKGVDGGWWFDDSRSLRPVYLASAGLLEGELRLYRHKAAGSSEYRKAYRLTALGRLALARSKDSPL